MMLAGPTAGRCADDPQESIRRKLEEFEARLKRIEAQQSAAPAVTPTSAEVEELRRQLDILAGEVEKLRSGEQEREVPPGRVQSLGVGPSAASVYRKQHGVSLAGYGEMVYERFDSQNQSGAALSNRSRLDFLRAVLYAGYRFNDRFVFNSEIEFEHASTGRGGEVSLEFAYLDYLAHRNLTLRGGMLLIPMGLANEFHEPTAFLGVRRSETESVIIPSTWRENGFGILGSAGMFQYRAYLVNGLDAGGFSAGGLRGGRQKGAKAEASDMAFVGRLDLVPAPGLLMGGSLYRGSSDQNKFGSGVDVGTTIGELHGQVQMRGWDLRALFASASLDGVSRLNQARGLTGKSSVGSRLQGGYLQAGYNVLSRFHEHVKLTPYYRFEKVNTQAEVPAGFFADPAMNRTFHTFGWEFSPLHGIVLKADYQWIRNRARSGLNQFNIGMGYAF